MLLPFNWTAISDIVLSTIGPLGGGAGARGIRTAPFVFAWKTLPEKPPTAAGRARSGAPELRAGESDGKNTEEDNDGDED